MVWDVVFDDDFARESADCEQEVKIELRAMVLLLKARGPELGRPRADTLKDSHYANMKELRFDATDGVWRAAFAFDPERKPSFSLRVTSPVKDKSNFTRN